MPGQGVQGATGPQGTPGTSPVIGGLANQVVYKDGSNVATGSANLTFNGTTLTGVSAAFSGSALGALVSITQNGAGNALIVQDGDNPETTPFVIDAAGNVAIGATGPAAGDKLDVVGRVGVRSTSLGDGVRFAGNGSNVNLGRYITLTPTSLSASHTLTLPNVTGTVVTTGDTGSVTSTMILDGTILNADINAFAAIVDTKLATISTAGKVSNSATTATSSTVANAIVARDANQSFSAKTGTFTGGLATAIDYANAIRAGWSGTITENGLGVVRVGKYSSGVTGITINQQDGTGSGPSYHMAFYRNGNNTGGISDDGSNTFFNTSSDYRLKENVLPLSNALATIELLQPKAYNFIRTPETIHHGFLAHELAEVVPYTVNGEKDALDTEGNIRPQQVDYSKLTALLVGAVQELSARVRELENNQ